MPHITAQAIEAGTDPAKREIARVVLMPGDPLRAKYIAETYFENPVCFNTIRNMFGYTGVYKGRVVSVMGSGMGIPSFSLYATELYRYYDVDAIIRVGSAGGLREEVKMRDVVIAMSASTDSSFAKPPNFPGVLAPSADFELAEKAVAAARKMKVNAHVGRVFTSDYFYSPIEHVNRILADTGHLCLEMETAGLYITAQRNHKKALSILTISDHLVTGEELPHKERENSFNEMMEIALETAYPYCDPAPAD